MEKEKIKGLDHFWLKRCVKCHQKMSLLKAVPTTNEGIYFQLDRKIVVLLYVCVNKNCKDYKILKISY